MAPSRDAVGIACSLAAQDPSSILNGKRDPPSNEHDEISMLDGMKSTMSGIGSKQHVDNMPKDQAIPLGEHVLWAPQQKVKIVSIGCGCMYTKEDNNPMLYLSLKCTFFHTYLLGFSKMLIQYLL